MTNAEGARATKISHRCVYLPRTLMRKAGLENGDKVVIYLDESKSITIRKSPSVLDTLDAYFESFPEDVKALFLAERGKKPKLAIRGCRV